jgi:mannose-6-phosphate isomerase-like protein (cupin superfamily)
MWQATGEFTWHNHDNADELFLVVQGRLDIQIREPDVEERSI